MKLLITGGCGFLGSNLAIDAINRGDVVSVFDNLSRPGSRKNLEWMQGQSSIDFQHGDIRSYDDTSRAIRFLVPDAIFHLAGQVAMTTSIANPRLDFETNALGTLNVLEAVRQFCPEAVLVYSSTNKVYGDLEQYTYRPTGMRYECVERPLGFDEATPLDFQSPYGCSKGAADQYLLDYARIYGLRTVVLRHSSMYGGRQFATIDQGWIGWFCQKAVEAVQTKSAEGFTVSGNGLQVRDVLHADDMKTLYRSVVENIDGVFGQVFNVGGGIGNSLSVLELLSFLEVRCGVKLNYRHIPERQSDQKFFVADIQKARRLLSWEPRVSAAQGLADMYEWTLHQAR